MRVRWIGLVLLLVSCAADLFASGASSSVNVSVPAMSVVDVRARRDKNVTVVRLSLFQTSSDTLVQRRVSDQRPTETLRGESLTNGWSRREDSVANSGDKEITYDIWQL